MQLNICEWNLSETLVITRRKFIKNLGIGILIFPYFIQNNFISVAEARTISNIFKSVIDSPEQNMEKVIELSHGGTKNLIGQDDVVIIKVNGQQWNQGGNNLQH